MRKFAVAVVALCLVPTVYAQEGRRGAAPFIRLNVEAEIVKGAPYSAEVINESTQTLSDGNHIFRRTTSRVYRDSEGRTRREEDRPGRSPAVTIIDPVAGITSNLDADSHAVRQTSGTARFYEGTLNNNADLQKLTIALNGATSLNAQRVQIGGGGFIVSPNEQNAEERLASRTIEGLRVEGMRRTSTIAAGAIGNERAIVATTDEWTSPELKTLVLSEHSDPRTGTSTYKLVRVSRTEPAASLFQVPADYTTTTFQGRGGAGAGGRGGPPPR